jgi:hypothetical protein
MRLWLAFILLITNLSSFQPQNSATPAIKFADLSVDYRFGQQVTFQVSISPVSQVKELYLFLKSGTDATLTEKIPIPGDSRVRYVFDLGHKPLRPFASLTYWFTAVALDGSQSVSDQNTFTYEDNRFTWQTLADGKFRVHWFKGDLVFGQAIMNAAQIGMLYATTILPAQVTEPLNIYVYENSSDLQSALSLGQASWIAGHASPELGTILVSVAPGPDQQVELERQIPHELMHILIYQRTGLDYSHIPAWFNEGLASLAELTPNPDYESTLTQAVQTETLMPFASLCNAFPNQAYSAFLAYAESTSFVRFIWQKFGATTFQKMIDNYKNGLGCDEGVYASLGISLEQLEVRWQQESLHMDSESLAFQNLAPYLGAGLLVVLLPLAFGLAIRRKMKKVVPPQEETHAT